jgi:hypothetical protein
MIDNYHKGIAAEKKAAEKVQKATARQAKKAETDAERARIQAERGRGRGGCGCGCGCAGRLYSDCRGWLWALHKVETEVLTMSKWLILSPLNNYEDIPAVEMATTQPKHRLPRACWARAPRFLPNDDEEEDVAPEVVRPQPKPRPIRKQQVSAPQAPSLAHDTNIESPEDIRIQYTTGMRDRCGRDNRTGWE